VFSDELITFGGQPLTANIVTMSVMGALVMYIISMAALLKLRQSEPTLDRPYLAPFFPVFPLVALGCGIVCLFAVVYFNFTLSLLFLALMAVAYAYFHFTSEQRDAAPADAMLGTAK
jgi:ethanolamine permease